jgi:hypothetical protein
LTPEQLDQIASKVRDNLLSHLDVAVPSAMKDLGMDLDISDDDWQAITDQVFL